MKRVLFVSILAAALAVPSAAISSGQDLDATAVAKRGDFGIFFTIISKNGKPIKAKRFKYEQVDVTCAVGGPLVVSGRRFGIAKSGSNGPALINKKRRFKKTYPSEAEGGGMGTFRVTGQVNKAGTKVKGTIRVKGDYNAAGASDCDSGRLTYVAQ